MYRALSELRGVNATIQGEYHANPCNYNNAQRNPLGSKLSGFFFCACTR